MPFRKIISRIFAASLFIIMLIAGYFFYEYLNKPLLSPESSIPPGFSIMLETHNLRDTWTKLKSDNRIVASLANLEGIARKIDRIARLDTLLQSDPALSDVFSENISCFAIYTDADSAATSLFVSGMPDPAKVRLLNSFIIKHFENEIIDRDYFYSGKQCRLKQFTGASPYYFVISKGIFIGSGKVELVLKAMIQQATGKSVMDRPDLHKLRLSAGKNVDANIFVDYPELGNLSGVLLPAAEGLGPFIDHFAGASGLDLLIRPQEFLINGFTAISDTGDFLQRFRGQPPSLMTCTSMIPYNAVEILRLGIDTVLSPDLHSNEASALNEYFRLFSGNEASAIELPAGAKGHPRHYVLLKVKKNSNAPDALSKLAEVRSGISPGGRNYAKLYSGPVLNYYFGNYPYQITDNYYTNIGEYLLFANSPENLDIFLRYQETGRTLSKDPAFSELSESFKDVSNVFYYRNLSNSLALLSASMPSWVANLLLQHKQDLHGIQALATQFSSFNDLFYTTFLINYKEKDEKNEIAVWESPVNTLINAQPCIVEENGPEIFNILVFDSANTLYKINQHGKILWTRQIPGKIYGSIYSLRLPENDTRNYIFNTRGRLYLINEDGQDAGQFPIALNEPANSGLSVFDFDGKKDYRILFGGIDNKIYNYDRSGKAVKGWKYPVTLAGLSVPPQYIVYKGKDYLIFTDQNGKVLITDRRGRERVSIPSSFTTGKHPAYYVNETNSKGIFLTTDKQGHLTYIDLKGRISKSVFGDFSASHYFLYADFNADGDKDFIYLDGNQLHVYDRYKNVIFSYEFNADPECAPQFIDAGKGNTYLGIVISENQEILIFDNSGKIAGDTILKGDIPFGWQADPATGVLKIITAMGESLIQYKIIPDN